MANKFLTELKALCEKYQLCVVPEDNGKYELPLVIAPYEGENKSLYDWLDDSDYIGNYDDNDKPFDDKKGRQIDDDIDDEMLERCKERGIGVSVTEVVWDDKKKKMIEIRKEKLV